MWLFLQSMHDIMASNKRFDYAAIWIISSAVPHWILSEEERSMYRVWDSIFYLVSPLDTSFSGSGIPPPNLVSHHFSSRQLFLNSPNFFIIFYHKSDFCRIKQGDTTKEVHCGWKTYILIWILTKMRNKIEKKNRKKYIFFSIFFSGIPFGIPIIGFWYPEKYSGIPGISGYR